MLHMSPVSTIASSSAITSNNDNDGEIKLNLAIDSPRSSSGPSQSQSHSNDSTPCSSPPQSPNHKIPLQLTPKNSIDEYLYNHWVIKHDHHILYYTIDNEYPPSYGWKYNEKNQSALPKQYNLINFGAPPPDITRIPIIPEPMITFMDNDNINHKNGIISHGNNLKNGQTNDTNTNISPKYNQTTPIPFDWPVHYIDAIFKLEPKQPLPFHPCTHILMILNELVCGLNIIDNASLINDNNNDNNNNRNKCKILRGTLIPSFALLSDNNNKNKVISFILFKSINSIKIILLSIKKCLML